MAVVCYVKLPIEIEFYTDKEFIISYDLLQTIHPTAVRLSDDKLKLRFSGVYLICIIFAHTAVKGGMLALNVR